MKSVLISIQPKWCELIASGKKTVEVRKTRPKIETPFKVYIYQTIGDGAKYDRIVSSGLICGKVIGEFVCDRISGGDGEYAVYHTEGTCLTPAEIADYIVDKYAYFWHISDLVIYDKPRELSEFYGKCSYDKGYSNENCEGCPYYEAASVYTGWCITGGYKPITRPFQSWGYVESEDANEYLRKMHSL